MSSDQTGTVAAVGVGFARYLGILWPQISEQNYLVPPIQITRTYALSLSTAQLVGILLLALLTWSNPRGIHYGRIIQNVFTSAKIGSLLGVIGAGLVAGWSAIAVRENFTRMWIPRGYTPPAPGLSPETALGLLVALCVAQVGSLFAADAWNNITFTAGEVKNPQRNVPLSLLFGTLIVIGLYLCVNFAYLVVLPLDQIQHAPSDRVAGAMLAVVLPTAGAALISLAIMVSAFGCINGMLMSGARAYFAMAKDGLFFSRAATLNGAGVPGSSLAMQGAWAGLLVLIRTYNPDTHEYGNLYSDLHRLCGFGRVVVLHPHDCRIVPPAHPASPGKPAVPGLRLSVGSRPLPNRRIRNLGGSFRLPSVDYVSGYDHCLDRHSCVFRVRRTAVSELAVLKTALPDAADD